MSTATPVRIETEGDVAIIVVNNPPVNALSHAVRTGLLTAIEQLDGDPSVHAIVLHGVGKAFMAGADLRELEEPPKAPLLKDVLMRLESCGKPVIAALHGAVLGGGAETALASHYRCATADVQIGFPEVKLGLLPGAGGTVRLPRIAGAETTLDLVTRGKPVDREHAVSLGLVDRAVENVPDDAVRYAREIISSNSGVRRVRDRAIPDADRAKSALIPGYRTSLPRGIRKSMAVDRIIGSVEAALEQPFEVAIEQAQAAFQQCRTSSESRALRHLFWAERGSKGGKGTADEAPCARAVTRVGVVGAGTMGSGIAASFALAGIPTILVDTTPQALEAGLERVRSVVNGAVKKGRLRLEEAQAVNDRVSGTNKVRAIAEVDLVIEAVVENLGVKEALFRELGQLTHPGAVLATNTSTLDVTALANASGRPADVVGMHFFSPAHLMRLIEIVRTHDSTPEAVATALAMARRLGKIGVVVGNAFGFVGNRMLYAYGREKELMMLEGAEPARIDQVLEAFGMAMGPNAVGDLAGLDVGVSARRAWTQRPDDPRFHRVSELLVEHHRLGQKSGSGFYRYVGAERRRQVDPEVTELIRAEAQRLHVPQRDIADQEILERCLHALINEGARLLEEGIAHSAADIDVIWCNGYGFPRTRGGPMFYADTVGLRQVLQSIERYRAAYGPMYWTPAPLLERLAGGGGTLADHRADSQPVH